MAIQVYQAGSSGGVADAASKTTGVKVDNSGLRANLQQVAGIGNAIMAGAKMFQDQMESADLMKASNMYNDKMAELRNSLMKNKEENAMDNMAKYEEGRNKILEDIYKNGPGSIRGGLGRQKFALSIEKDWIGQKNQMRNYMMQESEKYQDTQLGNSLTRRNQEIMGNWNNPDAMQESIDGGAADVRNRYQYYGTEKQEAMVMKWKAQAYGSAINAAMVNDDYIRAGALLQEHGKNLMPEERLKMEKAVSERIKSDIKINKFQTYADQFGNNIEGAVAAYRSNNSSGVNIAKGMNFWNGINGTHRGSNQCANTVSEYITAAGGSADIISPLADGMQYKAEQKGLAFKDKNQLRDGDIVFWATGNWEASEDPAAINNDKHDAYHGTDHVGVYNAKTGKVYQSGEHGVSEIDLDHYKVTGFAHPGGRQKTATEMYKEEQELRSYMQGKIHQVQQQEDLNFKGNMKLIAGWKGSLSYDDAMKKAVSMAGADPSKIASARNAVNAVYYEEHLRAGNGKALNPGMAYGIEAGIRRGAFPSQEALSKYLLNPQVHASAEQYTKYMKMYDDAQKGRGEFKFNKADILKSVFNDSKLKGGELALAKEAAWSAIQDYINQQRMEKHREPDNDWELIKVGKQGITERYYGHQSNGRALGLLSKAINIAPGRLSLAGVDNNRTYQIDGTNDYYVVFKDPRRKAQRMSVGELYDLAYKTGE